MTVTGKIPPDALGRTLVHEHIFTNFEGTDKANHPLKSREEAMEMVLPYLKDLWARGYNSLVECTPSYIGKDVALLRELSKRSGLQIITNTGYYAAVDKKYLPKNFNGLSADELVSQWLTEWKQGVDETGIRPGFIKLGVGKGSLDSMETKLVRAGMQLSKKTGLALYVHTGGDASIRSQYQLARQIDFDLNRLVWVHAQNGSDSMRFSMARKGMWVSLDGVNEKNLEKYVQMIYGFREEGLLHRLLISHDDGWSVDTTGPSLELNLFQNGNTTPYKTIEELLLPELVSLGFSNEDLSILLVENPKQLLTIQGE